MSATVSLSKTQHNAGWILNVDGKELPRNTEWSVRSPFGSVHTAVVLDAAGKPVFDRPTYREAPNVNLVVWGRTHAGEVRIAVIRQPRPHADDPARPGEQNSQIVFGQTPMGFAEKLLGESIEETAARETEEETGARVCCCDRAPGVPLAQSEPNICRDME